MLTLASIWFNRALFGATGSAATAPAVAPDQSTSAAWIASRVAATAPSLSNLSPPPPLLESFSPSGDINNRLARIELTGVVASHLLDRESIRFFSERACESN
jgi:hypothetical protein